MAIKDKIQRERKSERESESGVTSTEKRNFMRGLGKKRKQTELGIYFTHF